DLVAGPTEPGPRMEAREGEHRRAVRRVARAGRGERGRRSRLRDPFREDLAVVGLAVWQERLRVDRLVALAERRIDAHLLEEGIHTEGPRLVGDDRDDAL